MEERKIEVGKWDTQADGLEQEGRRDRIRELTEELEAIQARLDAAVDPGQDMLGNPELDVRDVFRKGWICSRVERLMEEGEKGRRQERAHRVQDEVSRIHCFSLHKFTAFFFQGGFSTSVSVAAANAARPTISYTPPPSATRQDNDTASPLLRAFAFTQIIT